MIQKWRKLLLKNSRKTKALGLKRQRLKKNYLLLRRKGLRSQIQLWTSKFFLKRNLRKSHLNPVIRFNQNLSTLRRNKKSNNMKFSTLSFKHCLSSKLLRKSSLYQSCNLLNPQTWNQKQNLQRKTKIRLKIYFSLRSWLKNLKLLHLKNRLWFRLLLTIIYLSPRRIFLQSLNNNRKMISYLHFQQLHPSKILLGLIQTKQECLQNLQLSQRKS